ncbi:MAG: hypothetical protein J6J23_02670 [Clostridia bacterium]|nr:hypothetical protein [Clostridia bacterium]
MLANLLNLLPLILAQNEKQKAETYLGLAILALFSIVFIMDMFGKGTIGKDKHMKKILLFFSCLFIFIFIIIFISFKYKNS